MQASLRSLGRLVGALFVLFWLASRPGAAAAQVQGPATVTLSDGSQVQGTVLLYIEGQKVVLEVAGETRVYPAAQIRGVAFAAPAAPSSASGTATPPPPGYVAPPPGYYSTLPGYPAPPPGIDQADFFRAHELARLHVQREALRESNRRWQVPAAMLGLSVASILIGAGMFVSAWSEPCSDSDWECDGFNDRQWRTSIVMMTLGGALVLISTPMLILRASRVSRLKRVERTIQRIGGELSLAPLLTPRGEAGLGARLRF
jgi:hypothetical protein